MTIVLIARLPDGQSASMKSEWPPTVEDLRRLEGLIAASPGLVDAEWTGRPGGDVR